MLSPQARQVIANYLSLPFPALPGVSCPYFLNKGNRVRGALRVFAGKGSPEDIVEETTIISLRDKLDLSQMTAEQMKKFLVDNHLGIDCSGLVYYVLNAEMQARGKGKLKNILSYPAGLNLLRRLLIKLRPAENTNVKTFASDKNSVPIDIQNVQPGDFIIMLDSGKEHDQDHLLIVHDVTANNQQPITINYTHSLAWRADGKYHHGVRQGKIVVTDASKALAEQQWIEQNKEGDENETLERAKTSAKIEMRRLRVLTKA